jgi:RNA polymerase sigma-70 factor (ECF subfamily)
MSITSGLNGDGAHPEVGAELGDPCLFDLAALEDVVTWSPPPSSGDDGAALFRAELVSLLGDLRRFARRLAGRSAQADDLVQETCRRALEARHQFNAQSELRAWLFRILRNLHIDLLRRSTHEVVSEVEGDALIADPPVDPPVWHDVSDGDVTSALDTLSPTFAKTYTMYAVDHRSYAEIAKELNVPLGTVGTRLRRARLQLRQVILGRMASCLAGAP